MSVLALLAGRVSFACRWHKGSKTFLNNCNIQTKNFQRISIITDLIILYIIICRIIILSPFGPSLPLAVALVLVAAGPLLAVSLVTGTAASLAASVGRRSVGPLVVSAVSPVGRPVGRQWLARRWSLVVVGRPVGQPCRVRYKYVRTGGGPAPRKRAAVAGGGVSLSANTSLRCLIAKFFIFYFLFFYFFIWGYRGQSLILGWFGGRRAHFRCRVDKLYISVVFRLF